MDEKLNLSKINAAFKAQVEKRLSAPIVSDEAANAHIQVLTAPVAPVVAGKFDSFFTAWDQYYPKLVSLLGWASWVLPPAQLNIIKALLATFNNNIIPILKQILK